MAIWVSYSTREGEEREAVLFIRQRGVQPIYLFRRMGTCMDGEAIVYQLCYEPISRS